jgi:4-hydroxy-tetrahydrodipicolinate synthase
VSTPRFGRVVTAMVTPFTENGDVDFAVAADVARFLAANGSDGLVVAGSTGEGTALNDEEKLELFATVAAAVTIPVLAGTSSSDTQRSVALTAAASSTGVAGILATTPAYARPSQAGIEAHLASVAAVTRLPVMLYDIPSRTGRKIAAATSIRLARECPNVVALKDASGDLPSAAHVAATLGSTFSLYSGDDALTLPFLAIGGVGVVSVASHWAGDTFQAMIAAFEHGDLESATALNEILAASCVFEGSEQYPNPQPSKAALRHLGLPVGHCRLPLGRSDAALDAEAATVLAALRAARG